MSANVPTWKRSRHGAFVRLCSIVVGGVLFGAVPSLTGTSLVSCSRAADGAALTAEEVCIRLLDAGCPPEGRPTAIGSKYVLLTELARTPDGHRRLREMLSEQDPRRAAYAAFLIGAAADLDDIPLLLACGDRHVDNDETVRAATDAIFFLFFRASPGGSHVVGGRAANAEFLAAICQRLDKCQSEWKGRTLGQVRAAEVQRALTTLMP